MCCATPWRSIRSIVRRVLRDQRRPGLLLARRRRHLERHPCATCRPCCRSKCRHWHESDPRRTARASAHARAGAWPRGHARSRRARHRPKRARRARSRVPDAVRDNRDHVTSNAALSCASSPASRIFPSIHRTRHCRGRRWEAPSRDYSRRGTPADEPLHTFGWPILRAFAKGGLSCAARPSGSLMERNHARKS